VPRLEEIVFEAAATNRTCTLALIGEKETRARKTIGRAVRFNNGRKHGGIAHGFGFFPKAKNFFEFFHAARFFF